MSSVLENLPPVFDLAKAKPKDFAEVLAGLKQAVQSNQNPVTPLTEPNGWYTVTPEMAADWLLRNKVGRNREPGLPDIVRYARMMEKSDWRPTGQPIIFDVDGYLKDGQHRLLGSLLGGVSFTTYVITDAPVDDLAFAYIDDGKVRTAAQTLKTAGFNGLSSRMQSVIRLKEAVLAGAYNPSLDVKVPNLTNPEVLTLVQATPFISEATHQVEEAYKGLTDKLNGRKDVLAFVVLSILEAGYDIAECDKFFLGAQGTEEFPATDPRTAFRVFVDKEDYRRKHTSADAFRPISKRNLMGNTLIAFNLWAQGLPAQPKDKKRSGGWELLDGEDLPAVHPASAKAIAA